MAGRTCVICLQSLTVNHCPWKCLSSLYMNRLWSKKPPVTSRLSNFTNKTTAGNVSESYKRKETINQDSKGVQSVANDDEEDIRPALEVITEHNEAKQYVDIMPGKGPPPEPPTACCMSGCANCVWITYAEELKKYFPVEDGVAKTKEAVEQIDNPSLQMFVKLELGLL